jgi:RNA polymerase sigma-70 factor (ECF subfamily)
MSQVESSHLQAALGGDQQRFSELVEPYRRQLQAYCYRLLGSLQDAEDVVQETMLRAWRRLDTYEGRASFRAWLYKIATNASLDALERAARRSLPTSLSGAADPKAPYVEAVAEPVWLDPFPDEWLDETAISAEAHVSRRESVSLAFMTALQVLPPRQRAVLVLCDVLDWRASEAAGLLDMTLPAVNSALHRARSALASHYRAGSPHAPAESEGVRRLLERYVRAWETADIAGLVSLLKEDAAFSMPPSPAWYRGRADIGAFFASSIFIPGLRTRIQPVRASGEPAFAAYLFDPESGQYHAHSIHVLRIEEGQLAGLTTFLNPALFAHFALPDRLA